MNKTLTVAALAFSLAGCASIQIPPDRLERSQASIRGAEEVGAQSVPAARLHLQLAKDQTENAKTMAAAGDERAVLVMGRVEGHTDSQGSDATNQPLSQNRATAVRDYLVSKGVSADKISSIGMGSSRPITDNATAENRANNRRVEIIIGTAGITTR